MKISRIAILLVLTFFVATAPMWATPEKEAGAAATGETMKNVWGETVDIYLKTMGSSASATAHPDNDDGTAEGAVSALNKLKNLHYLGSIVVDEAVADIEMVASGEVFITARGFNVVFWNASADALTNDVDENGFMLTPVPMEIQ